MELKVKQPNYEIKEQYNNADFNIPDTLLFEEVPCYIAVHDVNGKILRINRKFRETFGNRIGDYCYEVYKQKSEKCQSCPMDLTLLDGKQHTSEEILFSPEGYPINVIAHTSPLFDENGNIVAIIEMATDITEEKRLQRKLHESTEKYKLLYDEVPCFISVQKRNLRIIDTNKRFREKFGDGIDQYCYEVYKHRTERCEVCPVAETFEDGLIHTSEEIVAGKDGIPINTLVIAAPIRIENNIVESVMEMSTDITELKRIQSQMANLGQLVSSLAHTIKGILMGLDGGMYIVESGIKNKNEENLMRGWEMVQRNVERISNLVLDMLYYAKSRIPDLKEFSIEKLCSDILKLYHKKFEDNNIRLIYNSSFNKDFKGDEKSIYTLLLNLIENAVHACIWDRSKSEHTIDINIYEEDNNLILSICDDGIGMTDEVKSKLFTPLYSTKGSGGTGFGLMVIKKVVDEHSGTITVESSDKCGAKFIIKFPLKIKEVPKIETT